jgi:hypothetical protein
MNSLKANYNKPVAFFLPIQKPKDLENLFSLIQTEKVHSMNLQGAINLIAISFASFSIETFTLFFICL